MCQACHAVIEAIIFSSFFADSWLQLSMVVGASVATLALLPPLLILTFLYVHLVFLPSPPHSLTPHSLTTSLLHHLTLSHPHPLTSSPDVVRNIVSWVM